MGRGTGIRAVSASSLQISFMYQGVRCREKIKLPSNAANLKFAANLKARIEHEIAVGSFDYIQHFPRSKKARLLAKNPAQIVTVGDLLTEWLSDVSKQLQPETYADYAEYVAHTWRPLYGKVLVSDLTLDRVQKWVAEQTTSRKRILNLLTPLRQAMRFAVYPKKLLTVDPLAKIKVKRPPGIRKVAIDPFSPAEIEAILPKLEPQVANMAQFWAWTGLRVGEIIALTWADIDFVRGVAVISRTARGTRRKAPKTVAGNREVKLLPPALEALGRQKPFTRMLHAEIFQDPGTRPRGNDKAHDRPVAPWANDKQIRVRWREALAAAGVRYRFPRQLRHTYASWMLTFREDPLWIAKQMGHADVSETFKTYAKFIPSLNPDAGMGAYAMIMGSKKGAS